MILVPTDTEMLKHPVIGKTVDALISGIPMKKGNIAKYAEYPLHMKVLSALLVHEAGLSDERLSELTGLPEEAVHVIMDDFELLRVLE